MKKLLLYIILCILIITSLASASVDTDSLNDYTVSYYTLDNLTDNTGNYDLTNTGASLKSNGLLNDYYYLDGSSYLTGSGFTFNVDNDFTVCLWANTTDFTSGGKNIFDAWDSGGILPIRIWTTSGGMYSTIQTTGTDPTITLDTSSNTSWNFYCHVVSGGNNLQGFWNAVGKGNGTHSGTASGNDFKIGRNAGLDIEYFTGGVDEVMIFNKSLNQTEISFLYANGTPTQDQQYPFTITNVTPPTPSNVSEQVENTAVVKQPGTTTITSASLQTILSSNFEVLNDTALYGVYTFNVESNQANSLYCQMDIDGIQRTNKTRTNSAGVTGSMTLSTEMFNVTPGNYTQSLRCSRTAPGIVNINNIVGVGHFMIDEDQRSLNYDSEALSFSTSSSSFAIVDGLNFTINNNTGGNFTNSIVLEWSLEYNNNAGSTEELDTYITINGTECARYPRTVSSGGSGSVGGDCILENATTNETYEILMYGKGTNAQYTGNLIVKQFFMSDEEIVGGTGIINGTSFSGETAQKIFNTTGGNLNHAQSNAFSKLAYSVSANQTTDVTFFFRLVNGGTLQSVNFTRTVDTTKGVLIGQDVFENLPQASYQLELWGSCPQSTCTIEGGTSLGYLTDVTTTVFNSFNVTSNNLYNDSSINTFNITNGLTIGTTTGTATIFTEESLVNFTVSSPGYFSKTILNHNTSNNIQVNLTRAYVTINAFDSFTNTQLFNFSVNDSLVSGTTTNGSILLPINEGNFTFTFNNEQGYYNNTFNFETFNLQNTTVNVTNVYNHRLSFTAVSNLTGSSINNFTIFLNDTDNEFLLNLTTTTGNVSFNLSTGLNYTSKLDAPGYAFQYANHSSLTGLTSGYEYNVLTTNSISINFYDVNTLALLNGTNVTAEFIGISAQTITTSNGTLYVDLLQPSEYTIVYSAPGYRQNQYILTVTNRSTTTLDLYLDTNASTLILMTVNDIFGNTLEGADITIQRYVNNSWLTEQIVRTDFQGRTEAFFTLSTEFYNFIISYRGTTFFGSPNNDANKKVIYAEDVNTGLNFFINILGQESQVGTVSTSLGVDVNLSFIDTSGNNTAGYFRFYYDDPDNNQHTVCLEVVKGYSSEVVCSCESTTVTSESSTLNCVVSQLTGRETYRAVGIIDETPAITGTIVLGFEDRIDWGLTGYFIATILVILGFFMFIKVPSISVFVGSGILILLSVLGVAFKDVSFGVWIVILVIGYLVASIRSNSGVNG